MLSNNKGHFSTLVKFFYRNSYFRLNLLFFKLFLYHPYSTSFFLCPLIRAALQILHIILFTFEIDFTNVVCSFEATKPRDCCSVSVNEWRVGGQSERWAVGEWVNLRRAIVLKYAAFVNAIPHRSVCRTSCLCPLLTV